MCFRNNVVFLCFWLFQVSCVGVGFRKFAEVVHQILRMIIVIIE